MPFPSPGSFAKKDALSDGDSRASGSFTSVLIAVVTLGPSSLCEGQVAVWFGLLTAGGGAAFFMHGAAVAPETCWRASATGGCTWR